jgi:hypothetical protein
MLKELNRDFAILHNYLENHIQSGTEPTNFKEKDIVYKIYEIEKEIVPLTLNCRTEEKSFEGILNLLLLPEEESNHQDI